MGTCVYRLQGDLAKCLTVPSRPWPCPTQDRRVGILLLNVELDHELSALTFWDLTPTKEQVRAFRMGMVPKQLESKVAGAGTLKTFYLVVPKRSCPKGLAREPTSQARFDFQAGS